MKSNGGKDCAKTLTMFCCSSFPPLLISTNYQTNGFELPNDLTFFCSFLLSSHFQFLCIVIADFHIRIHFLDPECGQIQFFANRFLL